MKCPTPTCSGSMDADQLCCKRCWFKIPAGLRSTVWRTWKARLRNPRDGAAVDAHERAKTAALATISPEAGHLEEGARP
jgi:hypothetical protein